jgi:flagellar L-ring protein precursor FlgH
MHATRTMTRRIGGWAAVALLAGTAAAQNNSLFSTGGGAAPPASPPVSQPADGTAVVPMVATPPVVQARQTGPVQPESVRNPLVLAVSPIAVAAPEPRRFRVGDLVTIVVRETFDSSTDANMKSEKDWNVSSELSKFIRLNEQDKLVPQTFPHGEPGVEFDYAHEYEGKGKSGRKDTLTTRITATILDVKPNGVLVLEAIKRVASGEEEYTLTLTGDCRSLDVSAQNTVLSTQLANLEVRAKPTGAVRDATRRGWLMRAVDFLRPI